MYKISPEARSTFMMVVSSGKGRREKGIQRFHCNVFFLKRKIEGKYANLLTHNSQ